MSVGGASGNLPELMAGPPIGLKPSSGVIKTPSCPDRFAVLRKFGSLDITPGPVVQFAESGLETFSTPPSIIECCKTNGDELEIEFDNATCGPDSDAVFPQKILF